MKSIDQVIIEIDRRISLAEKFLESQSEKTDVLFYIVANKIWELKDLKEWMVTDSVGTNLVLPGVEEMK